MRYLIVLSLVLVLLTGCATSGTLTSIPLAGPQADLLTQWQGMSDRVLDSYHLTHVRLIVQPRPDNEGVMVTSLRGHYILIDPRALQPKLIVGLGHELGHVVSGKTHDPAHQEANEQEANYRAVAILVIGEQVSEEAAFHQMIDFLALIATVRARLGTQAPRFHNACTEWSDLAHRFPQYPAQEPEACAARGAR